MSDLVVYADNLTPDEIAIAAALGDMAIGRGGTLDEQQTPVYLRGLVEVNAAYVVRACRVLERARRQEYEPVVPAIGTIRALAEDLARADGERVARAKLLPPPVAEEDEKPYFCLDCRDEPSAWVTRWCRGHGRHVVVDEPSPRYTVLPCGRRTSHGPHAWVESCACRSVNPVIHAHQQRMHAARDRKAHVARKAMR